MLVRVVVCDSCKLYDASGSAVYKSMCRLLWLTRSSENEIRSSCVVIQVNVGVAVGVSRFEI